MVKAPWLIVAVLAVSCSSKPSRPPSGEGGGPATDACADASARIEAHYREIDYKVPAGDAGLALADELVRANLEMVMDDCRAQPSTVLPCLLRATTVATIESECLIPLDDEGTVEGKRFGAPRSPEN